MRQPTARPERTATPKDGNLGAGGTIAFADCGTWQGGPAPGFAGSPADDMIALDGFDEKVHVMTCLPFEVLVSSTAPPQNPFALALVCVVGICAE